MITLNVNGREHHVDVEPDTPLLTVLRNYLGLFAAKLGCGLEQCRACAVLVDGEAVPTCVSPVELFVGRAITTLEGLGTPARPHPLQLAFLEEHAAQCGYCIPGMIITAKALLNHSPDPSDGEIREALAGNLCRCGTHPRIIAAVKRAAAGTTS
jgi:nicotinate dehydrogenase subunit A